MIDAKVLARNFTYNSVKLPDPDPRMTPEEVKAIYSHQYPELTTAAITGPEASGDQLQYSFVRAIGTKGCALTEATSEMDVLTMCAHICTLSVRTPGGAHAWTSNEAKQNPR